MKRKLKISIKFLLVFLLITSYGNVLTLKAQLSATKQDRAIDKSEEESTHLTQTNLDQQLYDATVKNDATQVTHLLKEGANPNTTQGPYRDAPLHRASQNNNLKIVKLLISNGANVRIKNRSGLTPIHYAWFYKNYELLYFLQHFLHTNAKTVSSVT